MIIAEMRATEMPVEIFVFRSSAKTPAMIAFIAPAMSFVAFGFRSVGVASGASNFSDECFFLNYASSSSPRSAARAA